MSNEKKFHLYNAHTEEESNLLSLEELCKRAQRIELSQRADWFVWKAGWPDWVLIEKFEDIWVKEDPSSVAPHKPKQQKTPQKPSDRRHFERFEVEAPVVMVSDGKAFKTRTKDLSEGGLSLKFEAPEHFNVKQCKLILSDPSMNENRVEVLGEFLPSNSQKGLRVRFDKQGEELAHWIKKVSKKAA